MHILKQKIPFYTTLLILYYSLALSNNGKSQSKLVSRLGWILKITAFINLCIFTLHHLITSIRDGIEVDISEDISVAVGGSVALTIIIVFKLQESKWLKVIADVADFSKFGAHPEIRQFTKRMNLLSGVSCTCYITAVVTYAVVAYNATSQCKRRNEEKGLHEFCGYFTAIRLPFEGNSLKVRLPIFLTQTFVSLISLISAGHVTFLVYEITEYLIFHISLLKLNLLEIFDTRSTQESLNRFKFCIAYHNHILELIVKFNKVEKITVGQLSFTAALIFGCIGNQIVKVRSMASIAYFVGYVNALFYICHSGQRIMNEAELISYALYESKWYDADAKLMRNMVLVLRRCQIPVTLKALPFGDLNYPLFLMIMKSAYTYLTLLTQST